MSALAFTGDQPAPRAVDQRHLGLDLTPAETAILSCTPVVLHAETYNALFALGVRGLAITGARPFADLATEQVVYLEGGRFELAKDMRDQSNSVPAIIIPCVNRDGATTDLVAWNMETGATATWRGAALLGEENLDAPRIDGDRLRVHSTVLAWLVDGRRGVVVLDAKRARWPLAEQGLIVADVDFGVRLLAQLALPQPDIHVDDEQQRAAA